MRNGRGLRALIAEDEEPTRKLLRRVLDEAGVEVVAETSAGDEALDLIHDKRPDVAVLDIGRAGSDTFEVLKSLARSGEAVARPIIVVVAALAGFAQALSADDTDRLTRLLRNADGVEIVAGLGTNHGFANGNGGPPHLLSYAESGASDTEKETAPRYVERLLIKEDDCITFLPVKDIDWVESDGNYVRIHAGNGKKEFLERRTLGDLEQQLDPRRFLRIHRSTIVHLDRVEKLVPWFSGGYIVHLRSGQELKLSRGYAAKLFDRVGTSL
ncbi:MAG: LytTR family DNA-binding domain-containing protein [Gemmatimonadota bacterium]